jgi:two-component system phosphate regulon response regulator PhoB
MMLINDIFRNNDRLANKVGGQFPGRNVTRLPQSMHFPPADAELSIDHVGSQPRETILKMNKILIVDDEGDVRDLVAFNLQRNGMATVFAKDGIEAVDVATAEIPDLIVLDLMLPGRDGFQVFKELRLDSRTKSIPVLMLTAKAQLDDVISGLELGADDYLTKPFSPKEMVLRVKALLKRSKTAIVKSDVIRGPYHLDKNNQHVFIDGERIDLTPTEFKLLLLLVERAGQAQSREDLLREVWGYRDSTNSRTLDTHIKRLREKIGDHAPDVETVRGVGYQIVLAESAD